MPTCPVCNNFFDNGNEVYCSRDCQLRRGEIGLDDMYDFIIEYKIKNDGNSPTVRIIKNELGYSSTSLVFDRLIKLANDGKIKFSGYTSRNIKIVCGSYCPPKKRS